MAKKISAFLLPTKEMPASLEEYCDSNTKKLPEKLQSIYGDGLVLNYQIIQWYLHEGAVAALFRPLFALMFFSFPYTIASLLVWSGLVENEIASVVELILLGGYTGPVVGRAVNEVFYLSKVFGVTRLLLLQMDIPFVIVLYLSSASTSSSKEQLALFLTGVGVAVPAFLLYLYCAWKRYTVYAFGFIGKYVDIPRPLLVDYSDAPSLLQRASWLLGKKPDGSVESA